MRAGTLLASSRARERLLPCKAGGISVSIASATVPSAPSMPSPLSSLYASFSSAALLARPNERRPKASRTKPLSSLINHPLVMAPGRPARLASKVLTRLRWMSSSTPPPLERSMTDEAEPFHCRIRLPGARSRMKTVQHTDRRGMTMTRSRRRTRNEARPEV